MKKQDKHFNNKSDISQSPIFQPNKVPQKFPKSTPPNSSNLNPFNLNFPNSNVNNVTKSFSLGNTPTKCQNSSINSYALTHSEIKNFDINQLTQYTKDCELSSEKRPSLESSTSSIIKECEKNSSPDLSITKGHRTSFESSISITSETEYQNQMEVIKMTEIIEQKLLTVKSLTHEIKKDMEIIENSYNNLKK